MAHLTSPKNEDLLSCIDPGEDHWWKVELIKNVATKPIKVTLMKSMVPGRAAFSEPIGFVRTIATREAVRNAADLVLVQVGGYADLIGDYATDELPKRALESRAA